VIISEKSGNNGDMEFSVEFTFGDKAYCYEFLSEKDLPEYSTAGKFLYCLNDTKLFSKYIGKKCCTGFIFTAGNRVPTKENSTELLDFDDMAMASKGAQKLGVVRGDVDNLGTLFARGLGQLSTIGRISQLSFLLKHFFSSLANLFFTKERNEFIIYSGGDDFFVIGPWNNLIDDLTIFRDQFEKYTCYNPAFGFSASFSLFDGRYPAFKFAEIAGFQEKQAKENKTESLEKNSISFLSHVVFWKDFSRLKQLKENLVRLVEEKIIGKSYIQLLQRIAQYNTLERRKPKTKDELRQTARFHRWKWYYAWHAARLLERKKKQKEVKELLDHINRFLFSSTYEDYCFIDKDSLFLIEIPARWAELITKS
jgi:CRISPR-associated protein Csm1